MAQRILDAIVFQKGSWFAKGKTPPDRNVPASLKPPGVTGDGVWVIRTMKQGPGGFLIAMIWQWCPLPFGNIINLETPGGPLPTVVFGAIATVNSLSYVAQKNWASHPGSKVAAKTQQPLGDGPWLSRSDGANYASLPGYVAPQTPTGDPPGFGGGAWKQMSGGYWYYDNGQVAAAAGSSSMATLIAAGVVVVGGGLAAAYV